MAKNTNKMLLVHMSQDECQAFNMMQGGESLNEDGIPEYSKVGELIKVPEVRDVFTRALSYLESMGGKVPPEMEQMSENIKQQAPKPEKSIEEKRNPYLKELEGMGTEGDTRIASIPENMAEFLIELKGEPQENPHTGLLMFGGKSSKKFFRAVLPIVGGIIGNVLMPGIGGTLLGSAAGSATGRGLTGQSGSKLWSGVLGDTAKMGLARGAMSLFPGVGNTLGSFLPGAAGQAISGFSGPLFAAAAPAALATQGGAQAATQAAGAAAPAAASAAAAVPEAGGLASFMSHPLTKIGMIGGMYGMMQAGQRSQDKKERERYERERSAFKARHAYLDEPWVKVKPAEIKNKPDFWTGENEYDRKYGVMPSPYEGEGYAQGGQVSVQDHSYHKEGSFIEGPGKGQDDVISTRVPHNSYIIDASTVADFGDGSSRAGAQVLKDFEKKIRSRFGKAGSSEPSDIVPVYLSDGEFRFSHDFVKDLGKLGNGGTDLGAKILKKMTIGIRKHKNSAGDKLPPKAKDPFYYIQKEASSLLKRRA